MTMNSAANNEWGSIFKYIISISSGTLLMPTSRSNSNGTYYGLSVEYVNRNSAGYVDFEKVSKFVLIRCQLLIF